METFLALLAGFMCGLFVGILAGVLFMGYAVADAIKKGRMTVRDEY